MFLPGMRLEPPRAGITATHSPFFSVRLTFPTGSVHIQVLSLATAEL